MLFIPSFQAMVEKEKKKKLNKFALFSGKQSDGIWLKWGQFTGPVILEFSLPNSGKENITQKG